MTNGELNTEKFIKLGLTKKQVKSIKMRFAKNFKRFQLSENYSDGANLTFLFLDDFCDYLEKERIMFKTDVDTK